jgi:hypothetical protein
MAHDGSDRKSAMNDLLIRHASAQFPTNRGEIKKLFRKNSLNAGTNDLASATLLYSRFASNLAIRWLWHDDC